MRSPTRTLWVFALAVSLATGVAAPGIANTPPHTTFADVVARSELVVLVTVHHQRGHGYTLDVEEVLKGHAAGELRFPSVDIGSPIDDWPRAVIAFSDPSVLDFRAPTIAWHVAPDGTIDPERYQQYPGVPQTLDAMLAWFEATASPDTRSASTPAPLASLGTVTVTVHARSDDPCPLGLDCTASVSISPAGSGVPVLEGTLDPVAGVSDPAVTATLAPGTYAVTVAPEVLGDAVSDGPDSAPVVVGGCGATLELVAEQPAVAVTAVMAWDQPACGITIDPRAAGSAAPPRMATPVRAVGQPPRFRPRGAPDATATAHGIRLDLWIQDTTLDQGQWLLAHLRVTNVGHKAITYTGKFQDLRCPPLRFTADTSALFDPGQTWTGLAAEFKERFVSEGLLMTTPLEIPKGARGTGCGDVGYVSRLRPGAVVEVPLAALPAYALRAQPLPPGTIHVSAAFRARRFGNPDRVSVSTDVTLAGEPVDYPSPGQLADAALSTPGFIEALELAPDTNAWMNANDAWWPKRPYPDQPRLAGAIDAPAGIVEIGQFVGSDIDLPFVVGAVLDPWTGESFGSYWG